MKKFIIMTTAIIRPELHNDSIGLFYSEYYKPYKEYIDKHFELHHIINIDSPDKLKQFFTSEQTLHNFNKIIPESVQKHYIVTETPGFGKAFDNIMKKINELGLIHSSNYYFWFEDDWKLTYQFNFFQYIYETMRFKCCAMTNTSNSQCGSFRGGPIMNGEFFLRYFNLVYLGVFNPDKDPERQVVRFIGKYGNFFCRKLKHNDALIKLVQIHRKGIQLHLDDLGESFYSTKFHKKIEFEKHYVMMENPYETYYSDNNQNYKECSYDKIIEKIDTESIVYLILKPYNFIDCGREFADKYNLLKWSSNSQITYS
jgi:hypothetical protein